MGRWAYLAILLFFFPASIYSQDRQKELENLCAWHVCNFEFDDALRNARALIKIADSTGNDFRKLSAYAFAGQAYNTVDDMGFSIKANTTELFPNSQTVATKYISALEVSSRQYHRQHICQKNRGQRIIFDQWIILQNREQANFGYVYTIY